MAPRTYSEVSRLPQSQARALPALKLAFNVDLAAIGIALALAALVRWNVLPRIGW